MMLGSTVVELRSSLTTAGTAFFIILLTAQLIYLPAASSSIVIAVEHGMWQSL